MEFQYVKSRKGNNLVVFEGFVFRKTKQKGSTTYWICLGYHNSKCCSTLVIDGDKITHKNGEHNHIPSPTANSARDLVCKLKSRAAETREAPQVVVAQISVGVSESILAKMPTEHNLKQMIHRVRKHDGPALPRSLQDLDLKTETILASGENFLKFDSGKENDRILIFSTESNLQLLEEYKNWLADGTFRTCPSLFYQLYTIHMIHNHVAIPLVYSLLPNKEERTYKRMLEALKSVTQSNFAPEIITTDFEQATINAFSVAFPSSVHRCCFFHLSQNIWRKIQANGLQQNYIQDSNLEYELKKLNAIAFVPLPYVERAFEELISSPYYEANEVLLRPIIDYMEDTYIGRLARAGRPRRPAAFPKALWNVYDSVVEDLSKTINNVEGWHNAFGSIVGSSHPSIWSFIESLKRSQTLSELRIAHLKAGFPAPSQKKYLNLANRLKTIANGFVSHNITEYLSNVALNL